MTRAMVSAFVAAALTAAPAGAGTSAVMAPPVEYAHAGIELAVPKGFEVRPLESPYDVMKYIVVENNEVVQAVTLMAFPMSARGTADEFAEMKMAELRRDLAIRHLKLRKQTAMPVAGVTGSARLMSYQHRGKETVAAQVYFIREAKGERVRICYVLTVESSVAKDKQSRMLPILGAVIRSIRLTQVVHPAAPPAPQLAKAVADYELGYSVRPPVGWYASKSIVGVEMGQTDYLVGGQPMPSVLLVLTRASADARTSEAVAKQWLGRAKQIAAKRKQKCEVASQGPAKLGRLSAWQFVAKQSAIDKPAPGAPAILRTSPPVVLVQRVACVESNSGGEPRVYMLILTCRGEDSKAAVALMDTVAASFVALSPATQPTTRPATTKPAATRPTTTAPAKAAKTGT